jgi:hypothetical protein
MAGAVFWVGADGNVYLKGDNSVNGGATTNIGSASQNKIVGNGAGLESNTLSQSIEAQQIADPNAPASSAPSNPTGSTTPALDTASVANTNLAIQQIAPLLAAALGNENTNFTNTQAQDDAQQQQQQAAYDTGTTTNQQNYDSNFMAAIRAGIQGLHGLFQMLRGTGAAGGTAEDQARNVVGNQTSSDIQTGEQTQKQNQTSLDSTLSQFLTNLQLKRQQDADTHANNVKAIQSASDTQLQDLYGKLAGYYGTAGDTANYNKYMGEAGGLTPQIAQATMTHTTPYDTTPVAVQAPQITAFTAPTQPSVVSTAPDNSQIGSGIFTLAQANNKKNTNSTTPAAAAPVAAGS